MESRDLLRELPSPSVTYSSPQGRLNVFSTDKMRLAVLSNDTETGVAGLIKNDILPDVVDRLMGTRENLLIDAVNNRTRERNYYRLYSQLLENQISDDDFDREIDERPDEYVVPINKCPTESEFYQAIQLSDLIKDADTMGDIESLFSFKEETVSTYCKRLTDGTV